MKVVRAPGNEKGLSSAYEYMPLVPIDSVGKGASRKSAWLTSGGLSFKVPIESKVIKPNLIRSMYVSRTPFEPCVPP